MATIIRKEDGTAVVVYEVESNYRHKTLKTGTKSILPDMENLPLDDELKQEAEKIYTKMGKPTRKDKKRLDLVFACLHFAYTGQDQIHSPKELATIVGIDPSNISKIIGKFSLSKVGYHSDQKFYTVLNHLNFLAQKIKLIPQVRTMSLNLASRLTAKFPILEEQQPDLLAGAIIMYILGVSIDSSLLPEQKKNLVGLIICNTNKLDAMIKHVAVLDNQV